MALSPEVQAKINAAKSPAAAQQPPAQLIAKIVDPVSSSMEPHPSNLITMQLSPELAAMVLRQQQVQEEDASMTHYQFPSTPARFVFADGHEVITKTGIYKTKDSKEIKELDAAAAVFNCSKIEHGAAAVAVSRFQQPVPQIPKATQADIEAAQKASASDVGNTQNPFSGAKVETPA